jgi:hypothetical protein
MILEKCQTGYVQPDREPSPGLPARYLLPNRPHKNTPISGAKFQSVYVHSKEMRFYQDRLGTHT